MNRLCALTLALAASPALATAAPVQWDSNGHYYELVSPAGGISWTAARDEAAGATHLAVAGHLVTLNSDAEWQFVRETFPLNFVWIGLSDEKIEGAHRWVTDEPLTFFAWLQGEPNNAAPPPGENWVWYEQRAGAWGWNDYRDVPLADTGLAQFEISYVVEYEPVATPEPSSVVLAACGLLGLSLSGALRRRRRGGSKRNAPRTAA
jgi:hypothetical protein